VPVRSIGVFAALAAAVEDAREIKHENERGSKSHKRLANSVVVCLLSAVALLRFRLLSLTSRLGANEVCSNRKPEAVSEGGRVGSRGDGPVFCTG